MAKQAKPEEEGRRIGPKFSRSVLPENYQIRRYPTPMAELLRESEVPMTEDLHVPVETGSIRPTTPEESTPVISTPVDSSGVELPDLDSFLDQILPLFPAARQSILLRLYRWSEGQERELVVSTPRLAAKTNMDERSVRAHLQSLVADGYLIRSMDGTYSARFGGHDRQSRGLLLRLSAKALSDLMK